MKNNRILLVDDHVVMRSGCRELLTQTGFDVVGEAADGEEACQLYHELMPDLVIMDLSMNGMAGLEAIRRVYIYDNKARIIVLTMHDDPGFASRSIKNGARGYVTKTSPPDVLLTAIKEVSAGSTFFSPDIAQSLAIGSMSNHNNPLTKLSNREFDIFTQLVEGKSTTDISDNLSLNQKTVSNYIFKIRQKLEVKSVAEMVKMAINYGIDKQNIISSNGSE